MPAEFLEGIVEIAVSPRTVPHPERAEIYTMGECIPLPSAGGESAGGIQSRVVLYYGSFSALALEQPGFDWREEAWETLTHELRHHLEWRANAPDLEAFDRAVEQNFARQEGETFDPLFYLDGEPAGESAYRVEDDVFLDRVVTEPPADASVRWRGRVYRVGCRPGSRSPRSSVSTASPSRRRATWCWCSAASPAFATCSNAGRTDARHGARGRGIFLPRFGRFPQRMSARWSSRW